MSEPSPVVYWELHSVPRPVATLTLAGQRLLPPLVVESGTDSAVARAPQGFPRTVPATSRTAEGEGGRGAGAVGDLIELVHVALTERSDAMQLFRTQQRERHGPGVSCLHMHLITTEEGSGLGLEAGVREGSPLSRVCGHPVHML